MKSVLQNGEELQGGSELSSSSKEYVLRLTIDGRLLLYKGTNLLWGTRKGYIGRSHFKLKMGRDNHLVLSNDYSEEFWATGVYIGNEGNNWEKGGYAVLQDDGNFVVYDGNRTAMWDTQTYDGQKKGLDGIGKKRMSGL